jgi:hypothetical protein
MSIKEQNSTSFFKWLRKCLDITPEETQIQGMNIVIAKIIDDYRARVRQNKVLSLFFLVVSYILAYWGFSSILYDKLKKTFLDPDSASIIAVTRDISFNSIFYQWLPYVSAILIIAGMFTITLRYYRRYEDLAVYYSSCISSLQLFRVLFKKELETDDFGNCAGGYKEKLILWLAEAHNPSYVFEHVLADKRSKFSKKEGGSVEQIRTTVGKTVSDVKKIVPPSKAENH